MHILWCDRSLINRRIREIHLCSCSCHFAAYFNHHAVVERLRDVWLTKPRHFNFSGSVMEPRLGDGSTALPRLPYVRLAHGAIQRHLRTGSHARYRSRLSRRFVAGGEVIQQVANRFYLQLVLSSLLLRLQSCEVFLGSIFWVHSYSILVLLWTQRQKRLSRLSRNRERG